MRSFNNQMLVNLVRGKAHEVITEWRREWEEEDDKRWEEELESFCPDGDGEDEVDAPLNHSSAKKMTVKASSADEKVKGMLVFDQSKQPEPIQWTREKNTKMTRILKRAHCLEE